MNESAARADRLGATPSAPTPPAPPSYLWQVPNKPVCVRMNLEMIDRLEREVVESFRSLSSRGSEVGGLLLGSVQNGNPARVTIEAFELVSCDYVRGPLYQFSEADAERFERTITQKNGSGHLQAMGYFRSHTRKGLSLDAEDLAFFSGHFREPYHIALLIRPYASKPSTGGIFIAENGVVRGEASYLEFPFRRSELERMPQTESKPAMEKAPAIPETASAEPEPVLTKPQSRAQIVPIASRREIATPPAAAEEAAEAVSTPRFAEKSPLAEPPASKVETPASSFSAKTPLASSKQEPEKERETSDLAELVLPPLERPRRNGKMIWITAGAAAGLLLLSGALIYPGFGHKGKRAAAIPGQDVSALALRVQRSSGELMLTWNRDSDAVKNATHGTLAISDGTQHENVALDVTQLRTGNIVYSPSSSDVSFQLSVQGQNAAQTSSESVRILNTRPSPLAENPASAAAPQKAAAPAPHTETPVTTAAAQQPTPTAPATTPEPPLVADNHKGPNVRAFHAESLSERLRPARPTDLPEAPGLTAAMPAAIPVAVPGLNATPALPAPPPPRATAPTPTPRAGGQIQEAKLISSKAPEYPAVAKQAHVQGVVVVSAVVGVDGKVKSATAVSGPPLLERAAVDAVKQWTYKPTTLNGAPIESETRVEVRFTANR